MTSSWEDDDSPSLLTTNSKDDRWDGEDEEKVKDNWDDDDEDDKKPAPFVTATAAVPKKKSRKQIIAEKEAKRESEARAKRLELEKSAAALTPEEKLAEKLRIRQIQEEADLQFAVDMMGIKESDKLAEVTNIKDADVSNAAGLEALGNAVVNKIRSTEGLEKRSYYVPFLENLCKQLCTNLEIDEVKKVSASLTALYNEKVKAAKPKNKKKGKSGNKLNVGKEVDALGYYDDFDEFI